MSHPPTHSKSQASADACGVDFPSPARPVRSEVLFDGASELLIEHRGMLYRLRQTALGKLILTK